MNRPTEGAATWRQWFASLTAPQREAVRLCWLEGYTIREASACLGVTYTAIWSRLYWARKKARATDQNATLRVDMSETQ